MSDFLAKDYIYINSKDRITWTAADFYINVGDQIQTPNKYDNVVLLSASIPKSYYLINTINNTFQIAESTSTKTITIPVGNYSFSQMTSQLNTLMTTSGLSYTYVWVANAQTGKFLMTQSTGLLPSSLIFSSSSCYSVLGFNVGTSSLAGVVGSYTINSSNVVNFQLTNNIKIMSDIVDQSLLSVVIPDESDFSTILYQEVAPNYASKNFIANNTHLFHFWLLDGISGRPLDFNGIDVQFALTV